MFYWYLCLDCVLTDGLKIDMPVLFFNHFCVSRKAYLDVAVSLDMVKALFIGA